MSNAYVKAVKPQRDPRFGWHMALFLLSVLALIGTGSFLITTFSSTPTPGNKVIEFSSHIQTGNIEGALAMVSNANPSAKVKIRTAITIVANERITVPRDAATTDDQGGVHYYLCTTEHPIYKYCRIALAKNQKNLIEVVGFQLSPEPLKVVP